MALRALAAIPQRSTMLAESLWRSGIDSLCKIQGLRVVLGTQRGKHALRREWRFMQPNANCVVDSVRDRGNGRRERAFAAFFGAERTFGINTLNDDGLDLRRLNRRWASILEQSGIHQHAIFPNHFLGERLAHPHPDRA